jgi:hypothetical protein
MRLNERPSILAVIASEAKQSSFFLPLTAKKAGLLRRFDPRNDGDK